MRNQNEIEPQSKQDKVAFIRLKGAPYQQERNGESIDCTDTLERLALNTNYQKEIIERIEHVQEYLQPLLDAGYYGLDAKIKKGQALSFEEAFSAMTFVSMGVNRVVYDQLANKLPEGMPNDQESIFYQSIA